MRRSLVILVLLLLMIVAGLASGRLALGINGHVFLTFGGGDVKPAAGVQIVLARGNLIELLRDRAESEHQTIRGEILKAEEATIADKLKSVESEYDAEHKKLLAELERNSLGPRDCSEVPQIYKEAAANLEHSASPLLTKLASITEESNALTDSAASLAQAISTKVGSHAGQLKSRYGKAGISLSSWIKPRQYLDPQLCWKIQNKGDKSIISGRVAVQYNGRSLPDDVRDEYWRAECRLDCEFANPSRCQFPKKNNYSEFELGLGPGEQYTTCFDPGLYEYISGDLLRKAESLGLSKSTSPGSRNWRVTLESFSITSTTERQRRQEGILSMTVHRFADEPIDAVFAEELATYREGLPELAQLAKVRLKRQDANKRAAQIRASISESDEAVHEANLKRLQAKCKEVATLSAERESLRSTLQAGIETSRELEQRVATKTLARQSSTEYRDELRATLLQLIDDVSSAATHTSINGAFHFDGLHIGEYTLLADYETSLGSQASWVTPVQAWGGASQDLSNFNMSETDLEEHLMNLVLLPESQ